MNTFLLFDLKNLMCTVQSPFKFCVPSFEASEFDA